MASWKQKRAALQQAITYALNLPTTSAVQLADGTTDLPNSVEWEGKREANRWTDGVWCDLRLGVVVPIGRDERRYTYVAGVDAPSSTLRPTYGGNRSFNVMIIVGSDDQEDADAIGTAASFLRTRIRRQEVIDILGAVDIGLAEIRQTLNVDYVDEGRQYSQSMTEIRFNTVEDDEDTDGAGDFINEVVGSGTGDLAGVVLQAGPVA
jgi:hypothetical protein